LGSQRHKSEKRKTNRTLGYGALSASNLRVVSQWNLFYNPQKHQLEPVVEGDFRELAGKQDFVKGAPLNLVFIADYKTYEGEKKVEADKRVRLASLDAGHCSQNVYLYCASEGLKCVVRAGAQETELLKVLKLDDK